MMLVMGCPIVLRRWQVTQNHLFSRVVKGIQQLARKR